MTLMQFCGLFLVYLLSLGFVTVFVWREFRQVRFSFHLFFSLLFLLTFYFGFPLTSLLVFQFDVAVVPPMALLQALLMATGFYGIYAVSYKTRLYTPREGPRRTWLEINRVEAHLTWILLALVALSTVVIFFLYNGLLLFRLQRYSQIFSSVVSGVALKRFFYFFIPAMLVIYFLHQSRRAWLLFLISTLAFGLLTYALAGGTRANLIIAFALFLFIGITRRWISFTMLVTAGIAGIGAMFWLAVRRYHLQVSGAEAFYTFLYLTRDTFSPWENLALLLQHYDDIAVQGLAPIVRDFYVFIPGWLWPSRPVLILNSANYFTWEVLNNHSGLAISPTLIGSLLIMGGLSLVPAGAVVVGLIIKWFDWLYNLGRQHHNPYKAAILQSFCFGAVFNMIVLVREGLDAFCSRIVFFCFIFALCLLAAKLLCWLFERAGLIRPSFSASH